MNQWSAIKPLAIGFFAIAVLIGGFGYWAAGTTIAGAIVVPGQIKVEQNRQVVQHLEGGTVETINIREGDIVDAGAVLIELDANEIRTRYTIIDSQYYDTLATRARLEAERDEGDAVTFPDELLQAADQREDVAALVAGQESLFHARVDSTERERDQLNRRISQVRDQIVGMEAQLESLAEQNRIVDEELSNQTYLKDRGLTQAASVLRLQREKADLTGRLGELRASVAQAEGRITETEIEIIKLTTNRREEAITQLRELDARYVELAESRQSLSDQLKRMQITAPVGGVVHNLRVFAERSVIRPADPIMNIIPQDRPLIVTGQVNPANIDEVHVGMPVSLRMAAIEQRITPELEGRVDVISADTLEDERSGQSFYTVEMSLVEGELSKLPEGAELVPGMPVQAFIRTGERTPLAYLLKPLTDYFMAAFRET